MEVTATVAANTLGELLERVVAGDRITITRYGRPVAELGPPREADEPRTCFCGRCDYCREGLFDTEVLA